MLRPLLHLASVILKAADGVLGSGKEKKVQIISRTESCLGPDLQFSSVTQSCPTLCDPMGYSTPGFPVHHQTFNGCLITILYAWIVITPL